ncbi:MAG TPA: hypothetical protein VHV57_07510 [Acidimicrobiales bacterium]|jgi:hypothetical protein|nr:hypothetical protein [Acidimicrobiales bacterium]
MEDDIAERPRSWGRTVNVVWKGTVARLADTGLVGETVNPPSQVPVGLATTFFFGLMFIVFALKLWAPAMLTWHEVSYVKASWLTTVADALMTFVLVSTGLALALGLIATLWSAIRRIVQGSGRELIVPIVAVTSSAAYVAIATHLALRNVLARGGIQWSYPGLALKQIAGATWSVIDTFENAVLRPGWYSDGHVLGLAPFAILIFGVSIMTLFRRMHGLAFVDRLGRFAMTGLTGSIAVFALAYLFWDFGGGAGVQGLAPYGSRFPFAELLTIGALLVGCASCRIASGKYHAIDPPA